MLTTYLTVFLSIFFGFISFYRINQDRCPVEVNATIVNITEQKMSVLHRFYELTYYYPEIKFEYFFNETKHKGIINKKKARVYRVSELDDFGSRRLDNEYFWRSLKEGDICKIKVSNVNPKRFNFYNGQSKQYRSEKVVLIAISFLFLLLSIISFQLKI